MADGASLLELPPEVFLPICSHLPTSSVAALELAAASLHLRVVEAGVWRERVKAANEAKEIAFVTKLLDFTKEHNLTDQRVFKVILGLGRIVMRAFKHFCGRENVTAQLYRWLWPGAVLDLTRVSSVINKIISMRRYEVQLYQVDVNFYNKCFLGKEINVAAILEEFEEETAERFKFKMDVAIGEAWWST